VRDYRELWVLNLASNHLRKLADSRIIAPYDAGSILFSPAFSLEGEALYFGVVEETFHGEDDRLDNLWTVSTSGGSPSRLTALTVPPGSQSWAVLRGPLVLPEGLLIASYGESLLNPWEVVAVGEGGSLDSLGPLPPLTFPVAANGNHLTFLTMNPETTKFSLILMRAPLGERGWSAWCEDGCEILAEEVDAAAMVTIGESH
jgi:hypothetical protein